MILPKLRSEASQGYKEYFQAMAGKNLGKDIENQYYKEQLNFEDNQTMEWVFRTILWLTVSEMSAKLQQYLELKL